MNDAIERTDLFSMFWKEQGEWSQKAFGSDSTRGPIGPLKHLLKEAQEAIDNPTDKKEFVDCLFLVVDAARRSGLFTCPDAFMLECFIKLGENKLREWQTPVNDEPVEHVRGTTR